MTVTIQLDERDTNLFTGFASAKGMTVTELAKEALFRIVEDTFDIVDIEEILAEDDGVRHTLGDVARELGIEYV